MESVLAAAITGFVTLVGVPASNLKSKTVMEMKIEELAIQVEKHNHVLERTYKLEETMAVTRNDIETLYRRVGSK